MLRVSKPRIPSLNNPATNWLDDTERMMKLYEYCLDDVRAEVALSKALRPLCAKEQEIWHVDQEINRRGIAIDHGLVDAAESLWSHHCERLNTELADITQCEITSGGQVKRILGFIKSRCPYSVDSVDKESLRVLCDKALPPIVRRVIEIRQELSKSSVAKYNTLNNRSGEARGRIRSLFMYHGATTGRWTGKAFQPQNLPAGRGLGAFDPENCIEIAKQNDLDLLTAFYDPPMDYLSACVRGAVIPAQGKTFACADYSAIEARVLMWLVGEKTAVKAFADGIDIYKDLATKIFEVPFDAVTAEQRDLGKRGILGLGYQMGAPKFLSTCETYGGDITQELSEQVVEIYRKTYPKVKQYWWNVDRAAMKCVRTGKSVAFGKVAFGIKGDFLHIALPSGRWLAYYKPRIALTGTPWGEEKDALWFDGPFSPAGYGEQHTYGGKLTENIVQAIARDVLAEAVLRLEKHGDYPVVMHVHDEALAEPDKDKLVKADFEEMMARAPEWAPDLPISIDAWYGDRYHK
jgi:DNA polymerase